LGDEFATHARASREGVAGGEFSDRVAGQARGVKALSPVHAMSCQGGLQPGSLISMLPSEFAIQIRPGAGGEPLISGGTGERGRKIGSGPAFARKVPIKCLAIKNELAHFLEVRAEWSETILRFGFVLSLARVFKRLWPIQRWLRLLVEMRGTDFAPMARVDGRTVLYSWPGQLPNG
jgi:hypothetical protein